MVVCLVAHLVAAVDVKAHVVVVQGRAGLRSPLYPFCLLQCRELARCQFSIVTVPEEVLTGQGMWQDIQHTHCYELFCKQMSVTSVY